MPNDKMPWEMDLSIPTNTVQSAPEQPTGASTAPAVQNPWEMDLGAARQPVRLPKASPVQASATPPDWAAVNQQYAAGQSQRNQDQLATLQDELAREKDPNNRSAIQREISRVAPATTPSFPGMVEAGNIDLTKRPVVKNKDGSISTVRSIGVNVDGAEVLIPTVSDDGRILSDKAAIELYKKTGRHLGKFNSAESSTTYAEKLHIDQERMYGGQKRANEGFGITETDKAKRQELEKLPTITGKELVASGFGSSAGRAAWESKMKSEFNAATKGMNASQKDKYFSNYQFYAKNKYPKEYQMYSFLSRNEDLNDHAISFLDSADLKLSFTDEGLEGASGFVYNDKGDRAFLAPSANVKTVVHEGEHLRQQKDFEKSKFKSPHLAASDSSTPVGKLRKLTEKFKDDPAIKSVFSADNSYESSTEWLANLSGFMRTGIPQGKTWSDTPFYKKLVKEVGDKDAQTYLLDALLTLQRSDYTKKR